MVHNLSTSEIVGDEDVRSAVSWASIFAGTFVSSALSFMLLAFGAGMGLAMLSPLASEGASPVQFTFVAAIWLIIVQILSSGIGGYLTGRLRTKWVGVHTHEVYFRDTAHGFLTWAVATVIGAALALSAASAVLGGSATLLGHGGSAAMRSLDQNGSSYSSAIDSMLRSDTTSAAPTDEGAAPRTVTPMDADTKKEVTRLILQGIKNGALPDSDRTYLAQTISEHTTVSVPEADKKIEDVIAQARHTIEASRKAVAMTSIYTLLAMMIGAFISSYAATMGGIQRDKMHPRQTM